MARKKIKLDDYSGKSYEDAEASLKELGFSADLIQKEEEFSSEVESGMIISQSPSEIQKSILKQTRLLSQSAKDQKQ